MHEPDRLWKPAVLLQVLYFPLLGVVALVHITAIYQCVPAVGVLDALGLTVLLVPAASVAATALWKRWPVRLGVLLTPYAWVVVVALVWAVAALFA